MWSKETRQKQEIFSKKPNDCSNFNMSFTNVWLTRQFMLSSNERKEEWFSSNTVLFQHEKEVRLLLTQLC